MLLDVGITIVAQRQVSDCNPVKNECSACGDLVTSIMIATIRRWRCIYIKPSVVGDFLSVVEVAEVATLCAIYL